MLVSSTLTISCLSLIIKTWSYYRFSFFNRNCIHLAEACYLARSMNFLLSHFTHHIKWLLYNCQKHTNQHDITNIILLLNDVQDTLFEEKYLSCLFWQIEWWLFTEIISKSLLTEVTTWSSLAFMQDCMPSTMLCCAIYFLRMKLNLTSLNIKISGLN